MNSIVERKLLYWHIRCGYILCLALKTEEKCVSEILCNLGVMEEGRTLSQLIRRVNEERIFDLTRNAKCNGFCNTRVSNV